MTKAGPPKCNIVEPDAAADFEKRGIERLRYRGMRITRPRTMVLRVLGETRRPLGAYQIRDRVRERGGSIDVVSVYRILAALEDVGLAHRVGGTDGCVACTASRSGPHPAEYLICADCGCVEEVPIPQPALAEIGMAASRLGFQGRSTRIEVVGVCSHCR
ncbi:MAG: transcriptional repressor [Armatimonadetes bacterium]|nr:transcriptional repressor [Armatimonadota bacterium]